jgi:hypothetical protein
MSSPVHDVDALTTWRCRHPICGATQRPSEYGYMQAGRSSLAPRLAFSSWLAGSGTAARILMPTSRPDSCRGSQPELHPSVTRVTCGKRWSV